MRLWLGNNLLDDATGVLYVDGKELFSVEMTPAGASLPNAHVYGVDGTLLARLRRGAWVHRDEDVSIDTNPADLLLAKRGGGPLLRVQRHPDGNEVDALLVTELDMWSRAGLRYHIERAGPLAVFDRDSNKLVTFDACRFHRGFRGFQATAEEGAPFSLEADVLHISRSAPNLTVERSSFIPPGAED